MISHRVSANVLSESVYHEDVTRQVGDTWSQAIGLREGFKSASCNLVGERSYLRHWFESGLGRHWHAEDLYGNTVWEGMVWGLRFVDQGWQQTRSLDGLANRVRVKYTSYYTGGELNVPGPDAWYENVQAQAKYGIRDQILTIGEAIAAKAVNYGQTFLTQQAWPGTAKERTSSADTSLQVDLRGYFSTLGWRVYNNTDATGMATASTVIQDVVSTVGQYVAATEILGNSEETSAYHNRDKFAATILMDIVKMGGGEVPWAIGMYEDRTLYYQPVHTAPNMLWPEATAQPLLFTGAPVMPWLIRPNDVIHVPWLAPGSAQEADPWRDPMTVIVREANFTPPYSVGLVGTHDERLEILLERIKLRKW